MKKFLFLLAAVLASLGCAARRPQVKTVHFRNCRITDQRERSIACSCRNISWIRDVKEGWIAVCRND
jgi:hypothetical protein